MAEPSLVKEYLTIGIRIIQVPSFFLYLVFVIFLICRRRKLELSTSLQAIYVSLGVADLSYAFISTSHTFIAKRVTFSKLSLDVFYWYNFIIFTGWNATYLAQLSAVLLLSINRFTAVTRTMRYHKIWHDNYVLPVALFLQWLPPAIYTLFMAFHPMFELHVVEYRLRGTNETRVGGWKTREASFVIFVAFTLYLMVVSGLIIAMHPVMFMKMVAQRKTTTAAIGDAAVAKKRASERKLAIVGVIMALCVVYYSFSSLVGLLEQYDGTPLWARKAIASFGGRAALADYVSTVVDFIFTFSNPYLVLTSSAQCRRLFLAFVHIKKDDLSVATVAPVSNIPASVVVPLRD